MPRKKSLAAPMDNLKERAIRGSVAKLASQGASLVIRVVSIAILARLLSPGDFGIVAMVVVVTALFDILSSAGLAQAMVQSRTISDAQRANLFWVNVGCGLVFGSICFLAGAPLASFYGEPAMFWVAPAFGLTILMNSIGFQHSAYLERQLRYVTLARIEVTAQFANAAVAILLAFLGAGYWALVFGGIAGSVVMTSTLCMATGWLPGPPRRDAPVGSLLRFGATVTLNNIVVFIAYNAEKLLIGRFWGAAALGTYGRAYQLINIPTASINVAIGGVALSSLSQLQHDPPRQRHYFLRGYSLVASVTVPLTIFCALFGNDIIMVTLGPQWGESVPVFRLLAPTVLIFGLINPTASLLLASGLQRRSLYLAMVIAPLMLCAMTLGIPYGPTGVAFAISTAMSLWLVPTFSGVSRVRRSPRALFSPLQESRSLLPPRRQPWRLWCTGNYSAWNGRS